jgi:hypothetical protein
MSDYKTKFSKEFAVSWILIDWLDILEHKVYDIPWTGYRVSDLAVAFRLSKISKNRYDLDVLKRIVDMINQDFNVSPQIHDADEVYALSNLCRDIHKVNSMISDERIQLKVDNHLELFGEDSEGKTLLDDLTLSFCKKLFE